MAGLRPRTPRHTPLVAVEALLVARTGAHRVGTGHDDVVVTGVSLDSRTTCPGDLYAALPGHATHGAHFAAHAVAAGARAILTDAEGVSILAASGADELVPVVVCSSPRGQLGYVASEIFGHPGDELTVVGITGTNGKTTVAAMVAAGLRAAGHRVAVIGTVGTRIDDDIIPGARTTPEATDLQALLAVMVERGVDSVVMEVSSIAVSEHRVDGLAFDVMGFTNLSQDHLDYHGSMEAYFDAKAAVFVPEWTRAAVIGVDDEWGQRLAALARNAEVDVVTWSLLDRQAGWHAERDAGGVRIVAPAGDRTDLHLRLPGAFNVANALCAFALLDVLGVDRGACARGIDGVVVPGRMQSIEVAGVTGIVDYAHTPDAVERVLRAARDAYAGRVIVVVGAGGDRDTSKRALMGECAARVADHVIVTDDNPRSENPASIRAQVLEGVLSVAPARRASVEEVGDRAEAITVAVRKAHAGDVVLVLGKGHEQGQEVDGVITAFDDAAVLHEALAQVHPEASA